MTPSLRAGREPLAPATPVREAPPASLWCVARPPDTDLLASRLCWPRGDAARLPGLSVPRIPFHRGVSGGLVLSDHCPEPRQRGHGSQCEEEAAPSTQPARPSTQPAQPGGSTPGSRTVTGQQGGLGTAPTLNPPLAAPNLSRVTPTGSPGAVERQTDGRRDGGLGHGRFPPEVWAEPRHTPGLVGPPGPRE